MTDEKTIEDIARTFLVYRSTRCCGFRRAEQSFSAESHNFARIFVPLCSSPQQNWRIEPLFSRFLGAVPLQLIRHRPLYASDPIFYIWKEGKWVARTSRAMTVWELVGSPERKSRDENNMQTQCAAVKCRDSVAELFCLGGGAETGNG